MAEQIDNPILNSPHRLPTRHFAFDDLGITSTIVEARRPSAYFVPVPRARTEAQQLRLEGMETQTQETLKENEFVNRVRERVGMWRNDNYRGATNVTLRLLQYWTNPDREKKLYFCQIEALETLIYVTEIAEKNNDAWIIEKLKEENLSANPNLYRLALKMATGTGKTVLMAMVIAWQTINKLHYRQDTRFTDAFAVIAPGITIRDRLSVLQPENPNNYYRERDLVPPQYFDFLNQALVVITNYQALNLRTSERYKGAKVVREDARKESPSAMVNRVFKSIKNKQNILVMNDEAHHCYREKPTEEKWKGEERQEADENNEAARVWISGIEALKEKIGVSMVIDLSATPFFLRGSGYPEGKLFGWVVSDFSLIDAIESGIVKIPRVPVADDSIHSDAMPDYRNLWVRIREDLPKAGSRTASKENKQYPDEPKLPPLLETALISLYENYEKRYELYKNSLARNPDVMPPVMIVVCSNTSVSKMVYNWISGWQKEEGIIAPGKLPIFRNHDGDTWLNRPNTLVIDSAQIESGEGIDANFKTTFASEIAEFQREYSSMYPGREIPEDEDLLREVMNTVGKKGKLGEHIKCVVSVSMLTEGWDVSTVTHILGVRAFSTQLLCEQVIGRGLRRMNRAMTDDGMFTPEYAEVYGVPFSFIPGGGTGEGGDPAAVHRVRALPEREHKYEITFPRLEGYRYDLEQMKLEAKFDDDLNTVIENIPTKVTVAGVIGGSETHTLESLKQKRAQEVVYHLTKFLLDRNYVDEGGGKKYWLFPQLKRIVEEYVTRHVVLKDNMYIGLLLLSQYTQDAITKIQQAITKSVPAKKILPILTRYDHIGSTKYVEFSTTKEVAPTVKSHINYVVADTETWEQGVAKKLEDMDEVESYVKNQGLDFYIPYEYQGVTRSYMPDFIALIRKKDGSMLHLLIEVTGEKRAEKKMKVDTARNFWVPAVNNAKEFGEWAFIEIQDIHETQNLIRYGLANGFDNINS